MTRVEASLEAHAADFASELTTTVAGALGPDMTEFVAEASPRSSGATTRVSVQPEGGVAIELTISGEPCLNLVVDFECTWDSHERYLSVRKSGFKVETLDKGAPLFRYEFVNGMDSGLPAAHLHVHAHRDELLFAMFRGDRGKPAQRSRALLDGKRRPQLSDIHFPLGGVRMRPCLEDVLQLLQVEVGIDVAPTFDEVIEEGRASWRRRQIAAAVRDAPAEASRVLTELGYGITLPAGGHPAERMTRLTSP